MKQFIKRTIDIFFSIMALVILLPLFCVISILIKYDSKGSVFFLQNRIGYNGKKFKIIKFRTMCFNASNKMQLTINYDPRVTKIGKWLRRYKLDELPQLLNVLKGDMSLVGPRPEVENYVRLYPEQSKKIIFSMRPGITDLSSIFYVNESSLLNEEDDPEETYIKKILPIKIKAYEDYVKQHSLFLDFIIIIKTIVAIVKLIK